MSDTTRCKGCGAEITFRYTPNGRMMPLDVEVVKRPVIGSYVITSNEDCRTADPLFDSFGTEFHLSHFATCPKAEEFKS